MISALSCAAWVSGSSVAAPAWGLPWAFPALPAFPALFFLLLPPPSSFAGRAEALNLCTWDTLRRQVGPDLLLWWPTPQEGKATCMMMAEETRHNNHSTCWLDTPW